MSLEVNNEIIQLCVLFYYIIYDGTGLKTFSWSGWKSQLFESNFLAARIDESTVLLINMATVIGPTPPGTGVMYPATLRASS